MNPDHPFTIKRGEPARPGLFDDAKEQSAPAIAGRWAPIRLLPDVVTGEVLNVGVAFVDQNERMSVRILDSARPLKCLFGAGSIDNFALLLGATRDTLERRQRLISPSTHITFGPLTYAAGGSVEEVVDRLYSAIVTLARCEEENAAAPERIPTLRVAEVRRQVFDALEKRSPALAKEIIRREPVELRSAQGVVRFDLPLRRRGLFGTITSARYQAQQAINRVMDGAFVDMMLARQYVEAEDRGAIFVLRSERDSPTSEEHQQLVDGEIERVRAAGTPDHISVREGYSPLELAREIEEAVEMT